LRITLEGSVGRDHGTAPGIASALHAPVVGSAAQLQVRHTLAVTHEAGDLAASTGNADGTSDSKYAQAQAATMAGPNAPLSSPLFSPLFPLLFLSFPFVIRKSGPTVIVK
jgi:hypothetical protein